MDASDINYGGAFVPDEDVYAPGPTMTGDGWHVLAWFADALMAHPAVLSALAARAIAEYEAARAGSDHEALMAAISDVLHGRLEMED